MTENFPDRQSAEEYLRKHDEDAKRLGRLSQAALHVEEKHASRARGFATLLGGPDSKDELIGSILELRYPHANEARTAIALAMAEEAEREAATGNMDPEAMLRLVDQDSSCDYSESVGEHGGFYRCYVEDGILTVKADAYSEDWSEEREEEYENGRQVTIRRWKLVLVEDEAHALASRPLDKNERNHLRHLLQELISVAVAARNAVEPETGVPVITNQAWAAQRSQLTANLDLFTSDVTR